MQEPFRFIVDLAVMNMIEKGAMDNKDFVRTESFSLMLRPTGARKVTEEFNTKISHKPMTFNNKIFFEWDVISNKDISLNDIELSQYFCGV